MNTEIRHGFNDKIPTLIMYKVVLFFGISLFLFSPFKKSYSQTISKTNSEHQSLDRVRALYFKSLSAQSGIYRGVEYTGFPYKLNNGHQFFESIDPVKGSIYYDGLLYNDVPLWYDLVKNQVVVQYTDQFSRISLHNELIAYFSIAKHNFIHIERDPLNKSILSEGFYDIVYPGKSQLLVKRSKGTLKEVNSSGVFLTVLKQKNEFYLKRGNSYVPVGTKSSVLKALGTKQKEIQDYLKKNKIKFKKAPETTIITMVSYFDQISE